MTTVHYRYATVAGRRPFYREAGPPGAPFAQDAPDAEVRQLDGGHFLLESQIDTAAGCLRGLLGRTLS